MILSITNQKGGVGKTTTSVNLAAALAKADRQVLLIDMDPQGNCTTGVGVEKHDLERSSYDLLIGKASASEVIIRVEIADLDLIPSNSDLTAAEVELVQIDYGEMRLKQALQDVDEEYDYIIIDCPPSLNMLTLNAMVASDRLLVPLQTEYYALEGLSSLIETMEQVHNSRNPDLELEGLVRTMHDSRNNLSTEVSAQLLEHFGDKVYRTIIPRNVTLAEAPSHGKPVIYYNRHSRGAAAYSVLAEEMLQRHRKSKAWPL